MDTLKEYKKFKYIGVIVFLGSPLVYMAVVKLIFSLAPDLFPINLLLIFALLIPTIAGVLGGLYMYFAYGVEYHKLKKQLITQNKYLTGNVKYKNIKNILFVIIIIGLGLLNYVLYIN